ncbi:MAG TPA: hypothetical protein H9816_07455 [Candidatus Tidjanibacter faecipullorum]|uniref:Uncharacterized protein n=1 Tax=Candidatus Tidjanibacter faecipullorum TaxID=2838766 RepID=A0A9D2DET0_9BACT|nr:hypothetical protein [Candidatus Tidjanibacter faecipullorum]
MKIRNCETRMPYCAPQIEYICVQTEQGIALSGTVGDHQEGGELTPTSDSYVQF